MVKKRPVATVSIFYAWRGHKGDAEQKVLDPPEAAVASDALVVINGVRF